MALKLKFPGVFGDRGDAAAATVELDMPTTQVRAASPAGYDPLASVSIMEQLRTSTSEIRLPNKLPLIGHLTILQQFQVLGVMALTFLVFAAIMLFLESRNAAQGAAAAATATEMQMLSQRLARGAALAAQGQAAAFPAVKDSRDRFKADLDALQNGGTVRGVGLGVTDDPATFKVLQDIQGRWNGSTRTPGACSTTSRA